MPYEFEMLSDHEKKLYFRRFWQFTHINFSTQGMVNAKMFCCGYCKWHLTFFDDICMNMLSSYLFNSSCIYVFMFSYRYIIYIFLYSVWLLSSYIFLNISWPIKSTVLYNEMHSCYCTTFIFLRNRMPKN